MTTAAHHRENDGHAHLVAGAIAGWVTVLASTIAGFVVTPLILDNLGKEANGLWRLAFQVLGYYGLIDLSIGLAIIRYLSMYRGEGRADDFRSMFHTAVRLTGGLVTALLILVTVFARPIAEVFTNEYSAEFATVLRVMVFSTGLTALALVVGAVLLAHEEFARTNLSRAVVEIFRAVGSVAVLASGGGLVGLAWISAGAAALNFAAVSYFVLRRYRRAILPSVGFSRPMAGNLARYAGTSLVNRGGTVLRFQVDIVVINAVVSTAAAGVYGVVLIVVQGIRMLTLAVADVIQPRLSAIQSRPDEFRRSIVTFTNIVASVAVFIVAVLWVTIDDILAVWLRGAEDFTVADRETAATVFRLLAIGTAIDMVLIVGQKSVEALAKHAVLARLSLVEGVANLGLSILLGRFYGLEGVAIGTMVPSLLFRGVIQPTFVHRITGVPLRSLYESAVIRPGLVVVAAAATAVLIGLPVGVDSYVGLAGFGLACAAATAMAVWWGALLPQSRLGLSTLVANRIRR